MGKRRTYKLTPEQRACAKQEKELLLLCLSIDPQWAVRELCYLIQCLKLPGRITRELQLQELEKELALFRERFKFGRVWTARQLKGAYYAKATAEGFRRPIPKPMTKEEAKAFGPSRLPTLDVRHVLRHKVQVDLPGSKPDFEGDGL